MTITRTLKINGARIAVQDVGEGPPLVFTHGWALSQQWWWKQVEHLKDRYRVVTYDVRGHGRSGGRKKNFHDFQLLVDDLEELRDKLELKDAVVVGHSMGGAITLHHAVQRPSTLRGLVLVDSPQADGGFDNLLTMLGLDVVSRPFLPLLGDTTVLSLAWPILRDQMWSRKFQKKNKKLIKQSRREFEDNDLTAVLRAFSALVRREEIDDDLRSIKVPALVLIGQKDDAIPREAAEDLAADIPKARLSIVPKAGHMSMVEQSDFVNAQLDAYLAKVCAP